MDLIIDFYKNLDTINLIVFWGIIIVLILLLVFAIILINKNIKLKAMLNENILEENKTTSSDEIPVRNEIIKEENEIKIIEEETNNEIKENEIKIIEEEIDNEKTKEEIVPEKTNFIAEEYVMEYKKDLFSLPNIKKAEPYEEKKEYNKPAPYQKNILREISSNQTSPIGIIKPGNNKNVDEIKAKELYNSLTKYESDKETLPAINENQKQLDKKQIDKQKYISDVSKKLAEANNKDNIDRTEYEIKQEEEAIISYDELMKKKDEIKIIDEEEAVISIDELMQKKQKEKLYNLVDEEENDKFIDELKDFRRDL